MSLTCPVHKTHTVQKGPDGIGDVKIYDYLVDLRTHLADYIAQISEQSVKERGVFSVALSDESVINLMSNLCGSPYDKTVDWTRWHVFWADEKVVANSSTGSNYKIAKDIIISKVLIRPGNIHRFNIKHSIKKAVETYEFNLRQLVKDHTVEALTSSDCPKFDLILLGMGSDGHVASLFPGHPAVDRKVDWVTWFNDSPEPPSERITFTLPVINSAANVAIVVTGADKSTAVQRALGGNRAGGPDGPMLPAQMIRPTDGNLIWFLDRDAASKLDNR